MNELIWSNVVEIELERVADFRLHLEYLTSGVGFVGDVHEVIGGGRYDFD